jgi:hypothetical protein
LAGAATGGPAAAAQGAISGAGGGALLGGEIGERIAPSAIGVREEFLSPTVQLSASEEALRGQQLLDGLRALENEPALASYAEPLSQAYIQSMINLKRGG